MTKTALFFLALGLSMDAFAVSVSNSLCYPNLKKRQIFMTSGSFGLFQGLMPLIGFFVGRLLGEVIMQIDHWLALVLLGFIGGKMAIEGIKVLVKPEENPEPAPFTTKTMLVQAVATSIDALAVGLSLAALSMDIWSAAASIAVITFGCCVIGGFIGRKFGALLGDWAQIFGGLLLVGIGLKIWLEHMYGGENFAKKENPTTRKRVPHAAQAKRIW